ncbi:response regulator transcription factor [Clostridium perfringens]|uniref:response regulator transcription factor n=1 Tax=Clostridium perfringens TaxID=1502 RepID=UPI001A2E0C8B|nr:response regulator [Clostridium perfringens]EIF6156879.1 response regulator [Clostridium perfringens]EJT6159168.1 response regulator [Clostridium perfringens]MDN4557104.1 response regulator [Clostridium perfringens]MDT7986889.1 response regulator [Clostridium perfringens]WVM61738.1 response regulator [Clostridium perfringens]
MLKILLVDDEATEREGIEFLIKRYEFPLNIAKAVNGKEALEYIKKNHIDILFTDVKMPFMDGLELAKETFKYDPKIRIIIFSAYSEFDYAKKALEAKVVDYLLKPIEVDEFKRVMEEVIKSCIKRKEEEKEKELLMESSKKILLYKLLANHNNQNDINEKLNVYNIQLEDKYLVLINIETRDNFFEEREEIFFNLLNTYLKIPYEYINFYPNESYLLLYSNLKIKEDFLDEVCSKLAKEIKLLANENSSFFISNVFCGIEKIYDEVKGLNNIKENIYDFESRIIRVNKDKTNDLYTLEIENVKENLKNSINERNLNDIEFYINKLIEYMLESGSLSTIYIHHLFYDLIEKLCKAFNIYNGEVKKRFIEKILKCNSSETLKAAFESIIKDIAKECDNDILDEKSIANKVIKIIKNEYSSELSLDYIADKVNFTPTYLSYVFKKETGSNIVKYITDFRMNKAKEFLEEGNMKIVQVGKACGYENQSYFNRIFKNYFGVTPNQFKRKNS